MSDWHLAPIAAFDTETSGTSVEEDRIVTATLVRIHGAQTETKSWLINPGVEIPQAAIDVHGITNERAKAEGDIPAVALAQILAELDECWTSGRPVIAFNAVFDFTILDRELRRHCGVELEPFMGLVIDPFVLDKELDKYRPGKRTLTACCEHYGVRLDGAHDAEADALGAARVAYKLAQKYPTQTGDLATLQTRQADWRREWSVGFREYLTGQGKPSDDVRPEWPLIPFVGAS